jgi:hypothetical protein
MKFGASLDACRQTRPQARTASPGASNVPFDNWPHCLVETLRKRMEKNLYLLNHAYMVLLHKKKNAKEINNYRPISLSHSFSKLFAKLLSSRLAPHTHRLVMPNQSAFTCGRAIHDNFCVVQSSAKLPHAWGRSCILLKVDIAKAFDTANWLFLHDLHKHLNFFKKMDQLGLLLALHGKHKNHP